MRWVPSATVNENISTSSGVRHTPADSPTCSGSDRSDSLDKSRSPAQHRGLPNLFGHFQDRRRAGLPGTPRDENSGSVGDRPERLDGYFQDRRARPLGSGIWPATDHCPGAAGWDVLLARTASWLDALFQAPATEFDALPDVKLTGSVVQIEPVGVNKQGDITYTVVIRSDEHDDRLRWNMTATVTIGSSPLRSCPLWQRGLG